MVSSNISLDVSKNGTQAILYMNQGEAESRQIIVSFNNDGKKVVLDETMHAMIYADTATSKLSNEADIIDGKIIFTFPSAYLKNSGKFDLQIRIQQTVLEQSKVLYSPHFQMIISKTIDNEKTIIGSTDYSDFTKSIADMKESQIDSIVETVENRTHTYTVTFKSGKTQVFVIKDGKDGEQGAKGEQGIQGIQGEKGDKGDYPTEINLIKSSEDISPRKFNIVSNDIEEIEFDNATYYPGNVIIIDKDGTYAGINFQGFLFNGELFPLFSELSLFYDNNSKKLSLRMDGGDKTTLLPIPTKTSSLVNDSGFVSDSAYVHTDNNYTDEDREKLAGLSNYDDTAVKKSIAAKQDKFTTAQLNAISAVSGKQDKLTDTQLSNISAVPNKQDKLSQSQLDNIANVTNKQDKLTVGSGLKLENNVLSLDIETATAQTTYGGDTQ